MMQQEEKLRVSTEQLEGGLGLVAAAGYINNEGGQAIADAVDELVASGCRTILIDLEGTRIINSIGISILLEILDRLMESGGTMAFCNLTPTIAKTFEIMGLVQYAKIFPDRAAALAGLGRDG